MTTGSVSGPLRLVVVLVEFPDLRHKAPREELHKKIFIDMNSYFAEVSYNRTRIVGTTTSVWYESPGSWRDYAWQPPVTEGPWTEVGSRNLMRLVSNAIAASDSEVDFSKYGLVCIFTAGKLGMDTVAGSALPGWRPLRIGTNDGVYVDVVMIDSETSLMGTIAHELMHLFGLPDLYDSELMRQTAYTASQIKAAHFVGVWDNMGRMGELPRREALGLTAWSKIRLGWIQPDQVAKIELGQHKNLIVDPIELPSQETLATRVPLPNGSYYLVEVRRSIGVDWFVKPGILVTLCDDRIGTGKGPVRVIDANPRPGGYSREYATFNLGTNQNPVFIDKENNLSIIVLQDLGSAFNVGLGSAKTGELALRAHNTLHDADTAIKRATEAGRLQGLDEANSALQKALDEYGEANFESAQSLAQQAVTAAEKATKPATTTSTTPVSIISVQAPLEISQWTIVAVAMILVAGGATALKIRRSRTPSRQQVESRDSATPSR
jgi:M6 family metalloprotease-like protein